VHGDEIQEIIHSHSIVGSACRNHDDVKGLDYSQGGKISSDKLQSPVELLSEERKREKQPGFECISLCLRFLVFVRIRTRSLVSGGIC
jgi:hypothetical protein